MTVKEFRKFSRKAGLDTTIKVKVNDKIFETDISECRFQLDGLGNRVLVVNAVEKVNILDLILNEYNLNQLD